MDIVEAALSQSRCHQLVMTERRELVKLMWMVRCTFVESGRDHGDKIVGKAVDSSHEPNWVRYIL